MKNLLLTLGVIVLIIIGTSFKLKKLDLPTGIVEIYPNFYVDKTEITNNDWREYMFWTKRIYGENSKEYKLTIPDTTVWSKKSFIDLYLRHPSFKDYPVVGISYEQAVLFCKWRSDRVNESIWLKKTGKKLLEKIKNFKYNYNDLPQYVKFRLPTKKEWLKISNNKNVITTHIKEEVSTYGYSKTKKKFIYGLNSNVSEMVSEKGVAMGGNWKTSDNYDIIRYDKPSNTIGFRCVCEQIIQ